MGITQVIELILAIAAAIGIANHLYCRGLDQRATFEAGRAISGFIDLYYAHDARLDGPAFPELAKKPLPFPELVYRIAAPEFLHKVVAAEVVLPDDRVQELVSLSRLPGLRVLSISQARYADTEMVHFRRFSSLEYLQLSQPFNLTDKGIQELAGLKNLKVLTISGDHISADGVVELRRRMPWCTINGRIARPDVKTTEPGDARQRR
jgi:hypothetical protein